MKKLIIILCVLALICGTVVYARMSLTVIAGENAGGSEQGGGVGSYVFNDAESDFMYHANNVITDTPYSVSCWIKPDDVANYGAIWHSADATSTAYYQGIILDGEAANDYLEAHHRNGGSEGQAITTSGITVDTWHNVIVLWISDASRTIYIDGGNSHNDTTDVVMAEETHTITALGSFRDSSPGTYFSGKIAQCAVWNDQLSGAEITALAGGDLPSAVSADSLVAYWTLDEILTDSKGSFDMTNSGAVSDPNDGPPMN